MLAIQAQKMTFNTPDSEEDTCTCTAQRRSNELKFEETCFWVSGVCINWSAEAQMIVLGLKLRKYI